MRRPDGPRPGPESGSSDPDGIVRVQTGPDRPSWLPWAAGLSIALIAAGAVWWGLRGEGSPVPPALTNNPSRPGVSAAPGFSPPARPRPKDGLAGPRGDETGEDPDEEADSESSAPAPSASAREGIYAFPAPGTKRIQVGIVVPEGFDLPPGYVRHYQATDKGEMLPAILMFHPIHPPLSARGDPVAVPPDRVVPPDMAPPGLPIEMLRVPDNAYADPKDPGPIPDDVLEEGAGDTDP